MAETRRRPWWQRKPWIATAVLFWWLIVYPLSLGPAAYLVAAGRLPPHATQAAYYPVIWAHIAIGPPAEPFVGYVRWCYEAGRT